MQILHQLNAILQCFGMNLFLSPEELNRTVHRISCALDTFGRTTDICIELQNVSHYGQKVILISAFHIRKNRGKSAQNVLCILTLRHCGTFRRDKASKGFAM